MLDLFSPRAVSCSVKADQNASLVMDALMMAAWRRGKADALVPHSDRGSRYNGEQFQRLLADKGIIHKNKAARHKSRLNDSIKALKAA